MAIEDILEKIKQAKEPLNSEEIASISDYMISCYIKETEDILAFKEKNDNNIQKTLDYYKNYPSEMMKIWSSLSPANTGYKKVQVQNLVKVHKEVEKYILDYSSASFLNLI